MRPITNSNHEMQVTTTNKAENAIQPEDDEED